MEAVLNKKKIKELRVSDGYRVFTKGVAEGVKPLPDQNAWEWADEHLWLSGSAAAEPGKYHSSRTPYAREPLETLSPQSSTPIIVLMWSTQSAKTLSAMIGQACHVHRRPMPMASYLPREKDASNHSKLKWMPMVNETPVLRERIVESASRSENTVLTKVFPGGIHNFLSAETEASFRHMTYGNIHASEITSWPFDIEGQGDPTDLLPKRLDAFNDRGSKLCLESSPTIHKLCRIERWFLNSDQSYYFVPCPHCGHYQTLKWPNIIYKADNDYNLEKKPEYECEKCNKLFDEDSKEEIMAHGTAEWRSTHPEITNIRGFHLNALYSPFVSWTTIVEEWIRATKEKDLMQLKVFTNTRLAETWKEDVEVQDADRIASHREDYPAEVPAGVAILTAAVDVQGDRLEVEVKGWGPGMESWGIEHHLIYGEPKFKDVWADLDNFLFNTVYTHESGIEMKIKGTAIDSGYEKDIVYKYVKKRRNRKVFAVKGKGGDYPPYKKSKDKTSNIVLHLVGTNAMKERVIGWLSIDEQGPGYCHFANTYKDEFFDQFENFYVLTKKGMREFIDKPGKPVEAIDLFVYNRAVLEILGINLDREHKHILKKAERIENPPAVEKQSEIRKLNKKVKKKSFAMRGIRD